MLSVTRDHTRPLTRADRDAAVTLIESGVREVPLYQWLLGDGMTASGGARQWSEMLLDVHLARGVDGAFDDSGRLSGVLLWSPPGSKPDYPETVRRAALELVSSVPGFLNRYREMMTAESRYEQAGRAVDVVFAAVDEHARSSGVLSELVAPVLEASQRAGVSVVVRASDPALAAVYESKWGATPRARYTVTDGPTVCILQRDPR